MAAKPQHGLTSMTGFARVQGTWRTLAWHWEMKAVNGKALDVRFRLPGGLEHLEVELRAITTADIKRGNVQVGLALQGNTSGERLVVNEAVLAEISTIAKALRKTLKAPPIQAENLLGLKGVLEVAVDTLSEKDAAERDKSLLASFRLAVAALNRARGDEGARLAGVLGAQVTKVSDLVHAASECPARQPEAVRQRLKEQIARLLETGASFDAQRLHQEAMLLATKADIQEEIDRLLVHVASAKELLSSADPVGRKFDFLTQEFNREANTLCSKSSDSDLTKIGLELKLVVDQMREQVQNIE
jgi:uncharacterized protein (TIGR00255 family)